MYLEDHFLMLQLFINQSPLDLRRHSIYVHQPLARVCSRGNSLTKDQPLATALELEHCHVIQQESWHRWHC
jgi:hypothetical protein